MARPLSGGRVDLGGFVESDWRDELRVWPAGCEAVPLGALVGEGDLVRAAPDDALSDFAGTAGGAAALSSQTLVVGVGAGDRNVTFFPLPTSNVSSEPFPPSPLAVGICEWLNDRSLTGTSSSKPNCEPDTYPNPDNPSSDPEARPEGCPCADDGRRPGHPPAVLSSCIARCETIELAEAVLDKAGRRMGEGCAEEGVEARGDEGVEILRLVSRGKATLCLVLDREDDGVEPLVPFLALRLGRVSLSSLMSRDLNRENRLFIVLRAD